MRKVGNLWLPDLKLMPLMLKYIDYRSSVPDHKYADDTDATIQALARRP
jgi:hypothetical protein